MEKFSLLIIRIYVWCIISNFSGSFQQFLQIKNQLKLTSINIIAYFLSNFGFFKLYKKSNKNTIYALIDEYRNKTNKKKLEHLYVLYFSFIPAFNEIHMLKPINYSSLLIYFISYQKNSFLIEINF